MPAANGARGVLGPAGDRSCCGADAGAARTSRTGAAHLAARGIGLIAVGIIGYFMGVGGMPLLNSAGPQSQFSAVRAEDDAPAQYVPVTLADTEDIWTQIFADQLGEVYYLPKMVLFKNAASSPCGSASGAAGPFYCAGDNTVYLDTAIFDMMHSDLGARGDFAEALNAAKRIGDDTLQKNAGQRPMCHTFTYGTSAQRARWFQRGLGANRLRDCDTFGASTL